MTSIMEIMQLCRFCLVKDQVNIPIFEEQGDIRQIFLKLTACLPVKVSKDDNLPKKICDGCLYKLELLYQFWNTTANAEKQLLTWLNQAGMEANAKAAQEVVTVVQQSQAHSVKQEAVEAAESTNENSDDLSTEAQNYILQQQQLPYEPETFNYQQPDFDEAQGDNDAVEDAASEELEEPSPKRRRRQSIKKVIEPEEPDEDDDDISQEMAITKTEEESDTEEETKIESSEPTNFGSMGDSGDNEQPGPSGMGKVNTEAPWQLDDNQTSNATVTDAERCLQYRSEHASKEPKVLLADLGQLDASKYFVVKGGLILRAVSECTKTLTVDRHRCRKCHRTFTSAIALLRHKNSHRRKLISNKYNKKVVTMNPTRKYSTRKLYLNNVRKCIGKNLDYTKSENVLSEEVPNQSELPQQWGTQSQTEGEKGDNKFRKNLHTQPVKNVRTSEQGNAKHLKYKCFRCERRFEDCYQLFRHNVQVHHNRPNVVKKAQANDKMKSSRIKKGLRVDKNQTSTSQSPGAPQNIESHNEEVTASTSDVTTTANVISEVVCDKKEISAPHFTNKVIGNSSLLTAISNHKGTEKVFSDKNTLFNKFCGIFKKRNEKASSSISQVTAASKHRNIYGDERNFPKSHRKVISKKLLTCDAKETMVVNDNSSLVSAVQKNEEEIAAQTREKFVVTDGRGLLRAALSKTVLTNDEICVSADTNKIFNETRGGLKKCNREPAPAAPSHSNTIGISDGGNKSDKTSDAIILCEDSNESSEIYNLDGVDIICNDIEFENHGGANLNDDKSIDDLANTTKSARCADTVFFDERKPDLGSSSGAPDQDKQINGDANKLGSVVIIQASNLSQMQPPTDSVQNVALKQFPIVFFISTPTVTGAHQGGSIASSPAVNKTPSNEDMVGSSNATIELLKKLPPLLPKTTCSSSLLKSRQQSTSMHTSKDGSKGICDLTNDKSIRRRPEASKTPGKISKVYKPNKSKVLGSEIPVLTRIKRKTPRPNILKKIAGSKQPHDDVIEICDSSNDEADDETTQSKTSTKTEHSKNLLACIICKVVNVPHNGKDHICQSCKSKDISVEKDKQILTPVSKNVHSEPNNANESNVDTASDDEGSRLVIDLGAPCTSKISNPEKLSQNDTNPSPNSSKVLAVIEIEDEPDDCEEPVPASEVSMVVNCASCKKKTNHLDVSVRSGKVICKDCNEFSTLFDHKEPIQSKTSTKTEHSKNFLACIICKVVNVPHNGKDHICQSCKSKDISVEKDKKILTPVSKNVHSEPNNANESNVDTASDDEGSRLVIDLGAPSTSEISNPEKLSQNDTKPSPNSSKILAVIEIEDEPDDCEESVLASEVSIVVNCATCKKKTNHLDVSVQSGKVICKDCNELSTLFDHKEPTLMCFLCSESFNTNSEVINHKNDVHFCSICRKYRKNIAKHHEDIRNCKLCPTIFCKKITLNEHYRYHHFKRWCYTCDVVLNDDYEGLIHNSTFHKNIS